MRSRLFMFERTVALLVSEVPPLRPIFALAALVAAMLPLSAVPVAAADPYDINVILSTTGVAAFLGTEEKQSLGILESTSTRRGHAWDPALIVVDALRHVGTKARAAELRDYLEKMHGFYGVVGQYDFRDGSQRGITGNDVVITRWEPERKNWSPVSMPGGRPRTGG